MKPVPHGEPYAGKPHVRFDEGYPPKNGEARFEGSRRPSGRTRQQGALRSTLLAEFWYRVFGYNVRMRKNRVIEQNRCYHLVDQLAHRAFFLDDEEKDLAVALMRRVEAGVQVSMSYCINRADPFVPPL